jgi:diguanylate cyclase (GGDEF)-like protein
MDIIAKLVMAKEDFLLAFVDLDKLKYVNDTFGHTAGDEYISGVAQTIQNDLRASDILCRYGGDEFVLVLNKCAQEIGEKKLEGIRKKIIDESKNFPRCISFGFTHVTSGNILNTEDLIHLADQNMYEYKVAHREEPYADSMQI